MNNPNEINTEVNGNGLDKEGMVGVLLTLGVGAAGGVIVTGGKAAITGVKKGIGWIKDKRENGKIEKEIRKQQNEELKEQIRKAKEEKSEQK